jgi:hypothetical protein
MNFEYNTYSNVTEFYKIILTSPTTGQSFTRVFECHPDDAEAIQNEYNQFPQKQPNGHNDWLITNPPEKISHDEYMMEVANDIEFAQIMGAGL